MKITFFKKKEEEPLTPMGVKKVIGFKEKPDFNTVFEKYPVNPNMTYE